MLGIKQKYGNNLVCVFLFEDYTKKVEEEFIFMAPEKENDMFKVRWAEAPVTAIAAVHYLEQLLAEMEYN